MLLLQALKITLRQIDLAFKQEVTITVPAASKADFFNATGAQVLSQNLKEGENTIDLSMLLKGIYIVKTRFGVEKVVKE